MFVFLEKNKITAEIANAINRKSSSNLKLKEAVSGTSLPD